MAEFNKGDVVRLKSGGPSMTVELTQCKDDPGKLNCSWFDKDGKRHFDYFDPAVVEVDDGSMG